MISSSMVLVGIVCAAIGVAKGEMHMSLPLQFRSVPSAQYRFKDTVAMRIENNNNQWLIPAPDANPGMIEMFRLRDRSPRPNLVPWAGEFVGKYLMAAIQALRLSDSPILFSTVEKTIRELIFVQDSNGYLGPFPKEEQLLGHWDLWGHYHVMLALLMWYEFTADTTALACACRAGDLICATYLDTNRRPKDAGSTEMNLSVIHVLGRLYRYTGQDRYLRMMKTILQDWESPEAGDYYRLGLAGVPFYQTPKPRWESVHAIQGLVEMYQITGDVSYRKAFEQLWRSIAQTDIHNTGAFSTDEQAVGSPFRIGAVETCCQVAWTAMTIDMLAMTGDPAAADMLELGFWNAILGYQHPSGRWCTYNTPSNGVREASAHSIVFQARHGTPELNCCSVNAPRGLGMLPDWAVMRDDLNTLIVNFYGPCEITFENSSDAFTWLKQETQYPSDGNIRIVVGVAEPKEVDLRLRIPAWSKSTVIKVNDKPFENITAGEYFSIKRVWSNLDVVHLSFDMSVRTWIGDEDREGTVSLYYGPLLLTFDQKYNTMDTDTIPVLDFNTLVYRKLDPPENRFPPIVYLEFSTPSGIPVRLCDFANAGASGTHYASWLPAANTPPAPFRLKTPANDASLPAGPNQFSWQGPLKNTTKTYQLAISESDSLDSPVFLQENLATPNTIIDYDFLPGKTYYWTVTAKNDFGKVTATDGPRRFSIDPTLVNPYEANPALLKYREDGMVVADLLHGTADPVYGVLDKEMAVTPAHDYRDRENNALFFSGNSMVRYRIPSFPEEEFTVVFWAYPKGEPVEHVRQLFSAWARPMDDPLRIFLRGQFLFVGIERPTGALTTPGIPLPFNTWSHIAVTKKGDTLSLFLNGEPVQQLAIPFTTPGTHAKTVALGANPNYSGGEYFTGRLSEFAFYARALDQETIRDLLKNGIK